MCDFLPASHSPCAIGDLNRLGSAILVPCPSIAARHENSKSALDLDAGRKKCSGLNQIQTESKRILECFGWTAGEEKAASRQPPMPWQAVYLEFIVVH